MYFCCCVFTLVKVVVLSWFPSNKYSNHLKTGQARDVKVIVYRQSCIFFMWKVSREGVINDHGFLLANPLAKINLHTKSDPTVALIIPF